MRALSSYIIHRHRGPFEHMTIEYDTTLYYITLSLSLSLSHSLSLSLSLSIYIYIYISLSLSLAGGLGDHGGWVPWDPGAVVFPC